MSPALIRRLAIGSAVVAACLGAAVLLAPSLGFRWDPFDRTARRLETLETELIRARAAASSAAAVADAEARQAVRVEAQHRRMTQAAAVAADHALHAQEAADADQTLPPDRAARLRDADRRLCGLAPNLCAADAEAQPASGGDHPVSSADPA